MFNPPQKIHSSQALSLNCPIIKIVPIKGMPNLEQSFLIMILYWSITGVDCQSFGGHDANQSLRGI